MEYNDNPEFRAFLTGQMFNLMLKDFSNSMVIEQEFNYAIVYSYFDGIISLFK